MVKQRFTGHTVGEMNIISETRVCIQLVRPLQLVQVVKQWFTGCTVGDFYNIEYTLCLVCSILLLVNHCFTTCTGHADCTGRAMHFMGHVSSRVLDMDDPFSMFRLKYDHQKGTNT